MECPHLSDSVKVNRDFIKQKIIELSSEHTNGTNADDCPSSTAKKEKNSKLWKCLGKKFVKRVHRKQFIAIEMCVCVCEVAMTFDCPF